MLWIVPWVFVPVVKPEPCCMSLPNAFSVPNDAGHSVYVNDIYLTDVFQYQIEIELIQL
jgi:hypothetical protein